ncbi:BRO family protein [uncultured Deinococcus sp.]|uniref:BRO family protein n=1 Tax=uncultured Deinococcus sp. TaxID=158789 RepID=UPI0025EB4C01|nr:BRO family protein [uncultured Deinococcus sp.]
MTGIQHQAQATFDTLRRTHPDGNEYWSARDLMPALGYQRWENAQSAITRAIEACEGAGQPSDTHFRATTKKVALGGTAARDVLDYHLTRYAAYLTAMNSDPAKADVALAQTYFAAQTRTAEVMQAQALEDDGDPILAQLRLLTEVRRAQLRTEARVDAQERQLEAVQQVLDLAPIQGAQITAVYKLARQLGQLMGAYDQAWRLFKGRFNLASYRDLPRNQFDEAIRFLNLQITAYSGEPLLNGEP